MIGRAGLDGSVVDPAFITGAGSPCGLTVDGGRIYWANGSAIGRANVDGSGITPGFISGATPSGSGACGIAVDSAHVYWADSTAGEIGRANIDGTGVNQGLLTGMYGLCGLAVDGSYLYWAYGRWIAGYSYLTIGRANLDGTSPNPTFISDLGYYYPGSCGVAVDSAHVYWTWSTNAAGGIGRANLDGTSPTQNFIAAPAFPCAMAIDSTNIFWDNQGATGELDGAGIDGTGIKELISHAYGPCGIAVDSLLPSTVAITPSQSPAIYGQALSFTGQVAGVSSSTIATGTLDFTVTGEAAVPVTLNDSGQASFAPDYYLNVGDSVAASYDGDSTYGSSNRTIIPNIQPAQTATSLTATPNPADPTDDVTFTATVTNRSTGIPPFGSVQFVIDGVQLDPIALDDNGQAGIIVSGFDPGDHTVQAAYHDDTGPIPDFTDSQSSLNEHINSPPSPQPAPPTPPPLAATPAPNNNFTPLMAAVANDGTITLVESAPDPGVFTASAMTRSGYIASAITRGTNCKRTKHGRRCVVKKPGPALYGTGSATATTPGMVRLTIKPNAKAKWALTHGTTLRVSVSVTFQSARGGVPKTAVTTVTAKGTRSARKHPTRRHT